MSTRKSPKPRGERAAGVQRRPSDEATDAGVERKTWSMKGVLPVSPLTELISEEKVGNQTIRTYRHGKITIRGTSIPPSPEAIANFNRCLHEILGRIVDEQMQAEAEARRTKPSP